MQSAHDANALKSSQLFLLRASPAVFPLHSLFKHSIECYTRCMTIAIHSHTLQVVKDRSWRCTPRLLSRSNCYCSLNLSCFKYNRRCIECQQQITLFVTKCDQDHTYFHNVLITKEMFAGIYTLSYLCTCTHDMPRHDTTRFANVPRGTSMTRHDTTRHDTMHACNAYTKYIHLTVASVYELLAHLECLTHCIYIRIYARIV